LKEVGETGLASLTRVLQLIHSVLQTVRGPRVNRPNAMTAQAPPLLFLLCLVGVAASDDTPVKKEDWGCRWSEHWTEPAGGTGDKAVKATPPKKVHDSQIVWPEDTARHTGQGLPIVEAVLDAHGKVVDVRVVRPITWEPPCPEFDQAIIDAIRKWEYTPARLGERPIPVCLTITVNIHWR
jgi:TonB family protein